MQVQKLEPEDLHYPRILHERMTGDVPPTLYTMGDCGILRNRMLGLMCSIQCPGSIVIKTFDAIRALRDAGVTMIGGFHSPMEKECLDLLLHGAQPVVLCPAKGLRGVRIGYEARQVLQQGRLLLLSPFDTPIRRSNASQAMQRNNMVAALADAVFVPYATPTSKTWATVRKALDRNQEVFAFDDEANADLLAMGVKACGRDNLDQLLFSSGKQAVDAGV